MLEYSQFHDEQIILRCLERTGVRYGTCCEFGAWDGLLRSNTAHFIRQLGWTGVFIESNPSRYQECVAAYRDFPTTRIVNAAVTSENVNDLVPLWLDFMSIDIDGNDLWVWKALLSRPGLVCIEYNDRSANRPDDPSYFRAEEDYGYGATKEALLELAEEKDYVFLEQDEGCNLFFGAKERLYGRGMNA